MEEWVTEMVVEVGHSLSSEKEDVQARWLAVEGQKEKVAEIVGMEVRSLSEDALQEMGLSLKTMVSKVEGKLHAMNTADESWPVNMRTWIPGSDGGQQIEAPGGAVSANVGKTASTQPIAAG